jgi:hypothetical protein
MSDDPLYRLIKSLSKSEKIYFKKWASTFIGNRRTHYLALFDDICRKNGKTDEQLRLIYSGDRSPAHYPTLKQYLYDRIVESLCQSKKGQDWISKAESLKREAEVLIRRKLYTPGLKRLQKAQKLAYQLEHYPLLIDALRLENHTLGVFKLHEGIERKKMINTQIKDLLQYLEQERFYFSLYDELYIYSRTEPNLRDPEKLDAISRQLSLPPLRDERIPHSLRARHLFYGIHTTYHNLRGNYPEAYRYSRENLALWQHYPLLREVRFKEYLSLFINHINRCYQLKKKAEFSRQISALKLLKAPDQSIRQLIDDRLALFALNFHGLTGDFTDFTATRQRVDRAIARHRRSGNYAELRLLLYNVIYLLFIQEEYSAALDYSLAFDQIPAHAGAQSYLQRSNRLMSLLLHLELGNYQFLENTLRRHHLKLERAGQLFKFELLFLKMIRQFARDHSRYRPEPGIGFYLEAFRALKADPAEKKNFEYLDILSWLEGKRQNKRIYEVLYAK